MTQKEKWRRRNALTFSASRAAIFLPARVFINAAASAAFLSSSSLHANTKKPSQYQ